MIIYFADRKFNISGNASTELPGGLRIIEDSTLEEVSSGVNIFTCKVTSDECERKELEVNVSAGNFVLKKAGRAFSHAENTYDSLYQIVEVEYDTTEKAFSLYCEDAGLELINKIVGATTLTNKSLMQMLQAFVPLDWVINLIGTPTTAKTYTWDGENTVTERINSVAELFGCEVYYSFTIERMQVITKNINVTVKRGVRTAVQQLRLGKDVERIYAKTSIADLATALTVTGGTPDGSNTPINLKNYTYSYTDSDTGDVYTVDKTTGQMRNSSAMKRWASVIDSDGLIIKSFSYDTTNKATLAGQARAELQKVSKESVEYEVDFVRLPEEIEVGDRVHVIDEAGELYLDARLVSIETSECTNTQKGTIGEYVKKGSGISTQLKALAKEFAESIRDGLDAISITISSSGGNIFHNVAIDTTLQATVFFGTKAITTQEELTEIFGEDAMLSWVNLNGMQVGTGFEIDVSSPDEQACYKVRLEA